MRHLQPWEPAGVWRWVALLFLLVSGCAADRIVPVGHLRLLQPPHATVALAPDGGVFADLIGLALSEHGFTVIDTGATAAILVIGQHPAAELLRSPGLELLRKRGVGAVLVVERANGRDHLPQTVRVRLYDTTAQTQIGGIDWENSWIRRGVWEAAQEIGAAIAQAAEPASGSAPDAPEIGSLTRIERSPASPEQESMHGNRQL